MSTKLFFFCYWNHLLSARQKNIVITRWQIFGMNQLKFSFFLKTQIEIFSKIKCENIFFQIDAYFDLSMYVLYKFRSNLTHVRDANLYVQIMILDLNIYIYFTCIIYFNVYFSIRLSFCLLTFVATTIDIKPLLK